MTSSVVKDSIASSDGIILSKVDYPNANLISWERASHPVNIKEAEFHPKTNSLIADASPWFFYTPSRDAEEGTYVQFTYPILQNGISGNEVAEHFVSSVDVIDAGLNSDGVFQILLDASIWWRQTDWTLVSPPFFPLWLRLDQEIVIPGVRLACTSPKDNDLSWLRTALPVVAGTETEVNKSGEECYLISLESDFACAGKTFEKYKMVKITSSTVRVTPTEDTILLKVYR
jgi:hypothetical protein